jgi:glycosyltransferase involved in cell wall biosynthesis
VNSRGSCILWVTTNELHTGVIPSQFVAPARLLAEQLPANTVSHLVFLEPLRVALGSNTRLRLSELQGLWPGGRMHVLPCSSRLGGNSQRRMLETFARFAARGRSLHMHCRGPQTTRLAAQVVSRLGRGRVVFDCRGPSDIEAEFRMQQRLPAPAKEEIERGVQAGRDADWGAANMADAISAVTPALARRMRRLCLRPPETAWIPCCVVETPPPLTDRAKLRKELGVGERDLLLVHVSSSPHWEDFPQVLRLLRIVREVRSAKLLLLTLLGEDEVLASLPPTDRLRDHILVRESPASQVKGYLSAADVGLLLRRSHPTFHFAFPIKFPEYLFAGLPVFQSSGMAINEPTQAHALGVVVPAHPSDGDLRRGTEELLELLKEPGLRERLIGECRERFTWARYVSRLRELLGV